MEYPNPNIWDISMTSADGDCSIAGNGGGNVQWQHTFTFEELFNTCANYEFIDDDENERITLKVAFYLTAVSPNPHFLTLCSGNDCGAYLTSTFLIH